MKSVAPLLLSCLLLCACASTEAIKVVSIAGGRTTNIMISARGPAQGEDERALIAMSAILPVKQTGKLSHTFLIRPKTKVPMTHIRITDVTEDPETLVVDQSEITLTGDGHWAGYSAPLLSSDPKLAWVNHESTTMRVYRVIITYADGKKSELYSPFIVPTYVKSVVKKELGL